MKENINNKKIIENMEQKNIKVVSIVLPRELYPEVTFENSPKKYKLIKE